MNALQSIMGVNTPDANALKVALQQYQSAGALSPQMEGLVNQQGSEMNNIQTDPRLMNAQMNALHTMQQIGGGGLRPEDQAALAQIRDQNNQQSNSNRQAILQSMQQRGIGGSGAELAAQLSNSQSAANRGSAEDMNVASQASQRALQAIYGSGQMGAQMQGQQFNQSAQKAQAQDVINRYNAMNAQQVGNQNVAYGNNAQAQNLASKQALMNANTGIGNQQTMYNAQIPQEIYQDQLGKAGAVAGQDSNIANMYNNQAGNTQTMWSGIGQGVGKGAAAMASPVAGKQVAPTDDSQYNGMN
jgi:hypothetical protein